MKKYDVCGLGNALVDLLFECTDLEFNALKMNKGTMSLIQEDSQRELLAKLGTPVRMASGGSVANSVALIGQLGSRAALLCSVAKDYHGEFFCSDLLELGVDAHGEMVGSSTASTGTSLVVVTPDAERTMSTCLGACSLIDSSHIKSEVVRDSRWVFIEGYVIANSPVARQAIKDLIEYAKSGGTKIAITLSDVFVVNGFREFLDEILPQVDLIFCNDTEATALAGVREAESAFEALQALYKGVVVTAGSKGAYVAYGGSIGHVNSFACDPVDLTGAGDAFAGAFLQGLCSELSPFEAARRGCFFAGNVIQQWGARFRGDIVAANVKFSSL